MFILVQNFSIIYIKMGYPRLPVDEQASMVPDMLKLLSNKPQTQQEM